MDLTAEQWQDFIILQVGDTSTFVLAENIHLWWGAHDAIESLPLQAAYAKIDAIRIVLGAERNLVDIEVTDEFKQKLSQRRDALEAMLTDAQGALAEQILLTAGQLSNVVQPLSTTGGVVVPCGVADVNDTRYRGDPYRNYGGWRYRP